MSHHVLVVDDDDDIRETVIEVLEEAGHEAVGVSDGIQALDRLRAEPDRPCLILLDLMMPGMDGATFRAHQLQDPQLSEIPVVVISAFRDSEDRAKELQAAGHLSKPIRLEDLIAMVQQFC